MTPATTTSQAYHRVNGCINAKIAPCIVFTLAISMCIGCGPERSAPDVSHLDGQFALIRSEQALFGLDTLTTQRHADSLFSLHPAFWQLYFSVIMPPIPDSTNPDATRNNIGSVSDKSYWAPIISDPYLKALHESVENDYGDMSQIKAQLEQSFQYLQYYFPGNQAPNVYTLISGFGYFPFIFDDGERDGVGISLEMFLGADFPYRTFVGNVPAFSDYLVRSYNKDHVARKTMDVLVDDLVGPSQGERLVDIMVHNGIKLYILEHLMPDLADTVLFEFTPTQLEWCKQNERNLWAHYLKDDLIYSDEIGKIQKFISPAPGIPGLPAEAPGGVANWTGWRIIHALQRQQSDLKPVDLLTMRDAQSVLEAARYRPR